MYNTCKLPNGLRVIQRPSDGDIVYCGYAIKAGTRDEEKGEEGLAHFCEHASFKGTCRRPSWKIIQTLEGLGGELNAYTNKESTVYYAAILREHLPRAIDLLTDMVFHSTFPEQELEKEKEVICDEIESYNDTPADLIYDDFENIIFRGHPLGHNILGTKATVRAFTGADAQRFTRRHYRPENAIFFLHGTPLSADGKPEEALRPVQKALETAFRKYPLDAGHTEGSVTSGTEGSATSGTGSGTPCTANDAQADGKPLQTAAPDTEDGGEGDGTPQTSSYHQAHVIMGCKAYGINHPRRLALFLLNNIIGGPAMSSRLNMALRERNGLVYSVESMMTAYRDTGIWSVYFACDAHDVKRCRRLVRRELDRVMAKPLTDRQLMQAKKQLKGQIALSCDSRESFALDFAKSFLHHGWEKDVAALYRNIDALTAEELQEVAQELFAPDNIQTLEYGTLDT